MTKSAKLREQKGARDPTRELMHFGVVNSVLSVNPRTHYVGLESLAPATGADLDQIFIDLKVELNANIALL